MKRVFIAGIKGNMGKRYTAILRSLNIDYVGCDPYDNEAIKEGMKVSDGVIIATPTCTHIDLLREFMHYGKPILCEKPFTTNIVELMKFHAESTEYHNLISMVNQYALLWHRDSEGETFYNYFKTGNDGLAYDCVNLIGQARGKVEVLDDSPIWMCQINGQKLHLSDIDMSYISMILSWTKGMFKNYDYAIQAHAAVEKYITNGSNDLRSGAVH